MAVKPTNTETTFIHGWYVHFALIAYRAKYPGNLQNFDRFFPFWVHFGFILSLRAISRSSALTGSALGVTTLSPELRPCLALPSPGFLSHKFSNRVFANSVSGFLQGDQKCNFLQ